MPPPDPPRETPPLVPPREDPPEVPRDGRVPSLDDGLPPDLDLVTGTLVERDLEELVAGLLAGREPDGLVTGLPGWDTGGRTPGLPGR